MVNINELSIGNWVVDRNDNNGPSQPRQIKWLNDPFIGWADEKSSSVMYVDPLPITKETIKKYIQLLKEEGDLYKYSRFSFRLTTGEMVAWEDDFREEPRQDVAPLSFDAIHKLQNFLTLIPK